MFGDTLHNLYTGKENDHMTNVHQIMPIHQTASKYVRNRERVVDKWADCSLFEWFEPNFAFENDDYHRQMFTTSMFPTGIQLSERQFLARTKRNKNPIWYLFCIRQECAIQYGKSQSIGFILFVYSVQQQNRNWRLFPVIFTITMRILYSNRRECYPTKTTEQQQQATNITNINSTTSTRNKHYYRHQHHVVCKPNHKNPIM